MTPSTPDGRRPPLGVRAGLRTVLSVAVCVGTLVVASACGSGGSSSAGGDASGTSPGVTPATTPTVLACPPERRTQFAPGFVPGSAGEPATSADDAMVGFLASDAADAVRGQSFAPAPAPATDVGGPNLGEVRSSGSTAGSTPPPAQQWYAHTDDTGAATALVAVTQNGQEWRVTLVLQCVDTTVETSDVSTTVP